MCELDNKHVWVRHSICGKKITRQSQLVNYTKISQKFIETNQEKLNLSTCYILDLLNAKVISWAG